MNLTHVVQFALSQTWAMEPGAHRRMMEILTRHADGVKLSEDELVAATGRTMPGRAVEMKIDAKTGVATIPIHGVIAHRAGAVGRISSRVGTSVEHIREDLQAAMDSDEVKSIVLDIDSPGGSVSGIEELGAEIRAARSSKPIVAHTESLMASAAYWLGSQADRVFATKGAEVGSIGVISAFFDGHRAAANAGYDPVIIKSTPAKGGVQGNGTLSDGDRADIQRGVDQFHQMFVEAVAAGRGIDEQAAKAMGDGRVYLAAEAKSRGFIDGIASMAGAIKTARGLGRERAAAAAAAAAEQPLPEAEAAGAQHEEDDMTKAEEQKGASAPPTGAPAPVPTPTPAPATGNADSAAAERARCVAIQNAAADCQRDLAAKLVADGTSLTEALAALQADTVSRLAQAKALPSAATQPLGQGNTATVAGGNTADAKIKAMPEGEEKWKAEFAADADLQKEFRGDVGSYCGWKRNEQRLAAMRGRD